MGRDAIRNAERPCQERPVGLLDHHQPAGDQSRGGSESRPLDGGRVGARVAERAQLERKTRASPTSRDVVVQVRVEPLEARVEVGRQSDDQDLDVKPIELEARREPPQPEIRPVGVGEVRAGLDAGQRLLELRRRTGVDPHGTGEQLIDLRLRDVQAAEPVVGVGIGGPATVDSGTHASLDDRQPAVQVRQGRVELAAARHALGRTAHFVRRSIPRTRTIRPVPRSANGGSAGSAGTSASASARRPAFFDPPGSAGVGGTFGAPRAAPADQLAMGDDRLAGRGLVAVPVPCPGGDLGRDPRSADPEQRLLEDRFPDGQPVVEIERSGRNEVERWLQLTTERRPDVGDRAVLRRRQADGQEHRERRRGERALDEVERDELVPRQHGETCRQQTVLVLGSLRPGRHEIGQPVAPRRDRAVRDEAAGGIADGMRPELATRQILADVVQVEVDRRRVAPGDPLLVRRVEQDVDLGAVQGIAAHERLDGAIDLGDHRASSIIVRPVSRARADRPSGRRATVRAGSLPDRADGPAPSAVRPVLVAWQAAREPRRVRITCNGRNVACQPTCHRASMSKRCPPALARSKGVGTAVAAFVGLAAEGPFNDPRLVTNWAQFTATFGEFVEGSYLAHAVYAYFLNGGGACYIVRVGADGAMPSARAELSSATEKDKPAFRVAALEAGPKGNDITVDVAPSRVSPARASSSSSSSAAARSRKRSTT